MEIIGVHGKLSFTAFRAPWAFVWHRFILCAAFLHLTAWVLHWYNLTVTSLSTWTPTCMDTYAVLSPCMGIGTANVILQCAFLFTVLVLVQFSNLLHEYPDECCYSFSAAIYYLENCVAAISYLYGYL